MSGVSSGVSSTTGSNLDITMVSSDDYENLAQRIEQFYKLDSTVKTRLAYHWDRNHKFLDGEQWLIFDGDRETGGVWKRLTVSKPNEYVPRPVTNYIFDAYQTLKSYLLKNKPRSTVRPNTQTFRDKAAAQIAELCLEVNWEKLGESNNYEYAASCLITYGTVFKKDYWDTSSIVMVKIPRMIQQPLTDPISGQVMSMQEVQATDPATGQPLFDEVPLGDVNTDIIEPYRIALDPGVNDIHKAKWIMEYSIQHLDWIRETYDKQAPGYTGRIDEVKEERILSSVMRRFYNLKTSSGVKGTAGIAESSVSHAGESNITNSAVVKEYYERPSIRHPHGRMVVVANGITLFSGDSPYSGTELGDWHPYSECRWEIVPGRFWGKSPLDVASEIQKMINSIDSVIILNRKTMAIPQKLIPLGAGVANGSWTGRPGQEVFYRESAGAKPELLPAMGLSQDVFEERKQRCEDIKNCTGAIDILKGDRPPGVTAATALNMLYEVGTGKLYPVLDRWKHFVETSQKKQLKILCKQYQEPREDYINALLSKNKDLSVEQINQFIGADLYDNSNVVVEAGSNVPKLQAARQAMLMEAAQVGTLNLALPANRMEFNTQMGIVGFDNDIAPDEKRAEYENDLLDNIDKDPTKAPIIFPFDDHQVHMDVLARRMKEPSFIQTSQTVQQAYMQHYQAHMQQAHQQEMMQVQQSMAMGQPPQPPHSAAAPQKVKSQGDGAPAAVKNALMQDATPPGTRPRQ